MKKFLLLFFLIVLNTNNFAKNNLTHIKDTILIGTVKGKVIDASSEIPMINVTILYQSSFYQTSTFTDEKGDFKIDIPLGYEKLIFSFIGYKKNEVFVRPLKGSEINIIVSMTESVEDIPVVNILAKGENQNTSLNKMSLVNSFQIKSERTEQTAGVFSDPSKMLSNFAGIFNLGGNLRNDIIVRGNTPLGILWRIEGLKVTNPNHFSATGTNGGVMPILNNNNLQNADFYTSAFLPEYGDAFSGVYDLTLKDGNYQKSQGYGQTGFTGFELGFDGPIIKNKSSYTISYRYSFTKLLERIGINFFGPDNVSPEQQDLNFKTTLLDNKNGKLSLWGIGGLSNYNINNIKDTLFLKTDYKLSILGLNYNMFLKNEHYFKFGVAFSYNSNNNNLTTNKFNWNTNIYTIETEDFKINFKAEYLKKINNKINIKAGILADLLGINYFEQFEYNSYTENRLFTKEFGHWLFQPFIQTKYNFSNKISISGGVNSLFFSLNNSFSIDPRLNFQWLIGNKLSLNFGTGLHSKIQPLISYFKKNKISPDYSVKTNLNLNSTKSVHIILGFKWNFTDNWYLTNEYYYQYIYDVPISKITENRNYNFSPAYNSGENYINESKFSMINVNPAFTFQVPDSLVNGGFGNNYGTEISIVKNFQKIFYLNAVGTLFNSTFVPSDGKVYNTLQNVNFIVSLNLGLETNSKNNKSFKFNFFGDLRFSITGGLRKRSILNNISLLKNSIYFDDENLYKTQYDPTSNVNLRIGYRMISKKVSHLFAFDIQNLLNSKNIFSDNYSIKNGEISNSPTYQNPIIFSAQYRINFSLSKI